MSVFTKNERRQILTAASKLNILAMLDDDSLTKEQLLRLAATDSAEYREILEIITEKRYNPPIWLVSLLNICQIEYNTEPAQSDERRDRIRRLQECVLAIPTFTQYKAVMKIYANRDATHARFGRPDDYDELSTPATMQDFSDGMDFLFNPDRLRYIFTGQTNMYQYTKSEAFIQALRDVRVYIPNDLQRFTKQELADAMEDQYKISIRTLDENLFRKQV